MRVEPESQAPAATPQIASIILHSERKSKGSLAKIPKSTKSTENPLGWPINLSNTKTTGSKSGRMQDASLGPASLTVHSNIVMAVQQPGNTDINGSTALI